MRLFLKFLVLAAIAAAGALAYATGAPEIRPVDRPAADAFDRDKVERGEILAGIGSCASCHTAEGGRPFAGGRPLPTPFGTIYSTNITPDEETGLGRWSEPAFRRALREGLDRRGNHLYPAFPFDHFTKVTDEDIDALYAFLMTRPAVAAPAKENALVFPLGFRPVVAGWKFLFFEPGRFVPNPVARDEVNRGAYLVEGLGHCGACHTPRNLLGAEDRARTFAGGEAEGWHAPALNAASPSPIPWSEDALVNYLLDGWDAEHGIAGGPMTLVANEMQAMSEDDAYAVAAYLRTFASTMADVEARTAAARTFAAEREFGGSAFPAGTATGGDAAGRGRATFERVCANCHRSGGRPVPLALTSTVNGPDPRNIIHVIDDGVRPPEGAADRSMPAFRASLSDSELADLLAFIRGQFSKAPAWKDAPARIAEARGGKK